MGIMPVSAILFGTLGQVIGPSNAVGGGAVILLVWALVLVFVPKLLAPESVDAGVESGSLG
jgi:Na+/citrate or Na+/malate symporter